MTDATQTSDLLAEMDALDETLATMRLDRDSRIDYSEEWSPEQVRMIV